jgi:alpha-mannosidase
MTELKRSIFVIPSSSLEDLPTRIGHDAALDFLNAWTCQWDPRLLTALGTLPEWKKADGSALDLEHALVVCPEVSKLKVDQPQRERLELGQCVLVDSSSKSRANLVSSLLESVRLAIESGLSEPSTESPILLDDFYALGYAVLQIQILARKLRYSWNIDWIMFSEQTLSAARASLANDAEETERWLQSCFDSLSQERDRYCSQQAYLLDVILLATTTLGPSLDRQVETSHPTNLLATSALLKSLKDRNANAWSRILQGIADKHISLVGGLEFERPHSYLSSSAIRRELGRGIRSYEELGVEAPKVFSRYRAGFTASDPLWLTQHGYTGSLLVAWAEGTIPDRDQAKIRWQANSEGKSLDTIAGHVFDAASADSYIDLAESLSKQLDYHHVPTLILAHWPGIQLQPLQDLLRVIARTPALGKFHTAESYFASTSQPYSSDSFASNSFRIPIPKSTREQNGLHQQIIGYQQTRVGLERLQSLQYLWTQVAKNSVSDAPPPNGEQDACGAEIEHLLNCLDGWFDTNKAGSQHDDASRSNLHQRMQVCREKQLVQIRETLNHRTTSSNAEATKEVSSYLIANPSSHPQRLFLKDIPGTIDQASCSRIYASESSDGTSRAIVDIPPFGFIRFRAGKSGHARAAVSVQSSAKPSFWNRISGTRTGIARSDWTLANEFMEIQIDPKRGHLRSIYVANKRGSLLSGKASLVRGNADVQRKWEEADCLDLIDVQLRLIQSSPLVGTIEVAGTSILPDGSVGRLTTRYTLWKGARWVEIEIHAENLNGDQCGCVWRTAWLNEGASINAWQQGTKGKLQSPLQASVELIEIDDAEHRIYLAPRGLSAHRRHESRFLISSIPSDARGIASERFAVGLDWPRPYETAMDQCDTPWMIEESGVVRDKPDAGAWLAQCNLPNVYFSFTNPNPVLATERFSAERVELLTGQKGDACVWIQETQGKSGSARISFFRDVAEAWRVDSQCREFDTLVVSDGQIIVNVSAHEQSRILLKWKNKESAKESNAT